MSKFFGAVAVAVAVAVVLLAGPVLAQGAPVGDAGKGAVLFRQRCGACHQTVAGKNGVGPGLAKVVGRKAASAPGFAYTAGLKASGLTWKKPVLDTFLTDPARLVAGTAMAVSTPGAGDRADLIAYLSTL